MKKAESAVAAKVQELLKIYEGWLPPWAAIKVAELQAVSASKWLEHGEPHYQNLKYKISQNGAAFQKWSKPHVASFRKKWNPVVKKRFANINKVLSEQLKNLQGNAYKGFESGQQYVSPHIEKAKQFFDPYVQVVKEKTKPYVDTFGAAVGPHYQRARTLAEPHVEKLGVVYRDLLSSATTYHQQLQSSVKHTMKKHDLLASLASKEVVWFLASLVVALPVVGAFVVFSSTVSTVFGAKKPTKPVRSHKKARRVKQVDK
eukprot:TRINITY_DN4546_c0_g1_i2.p1 TRINITY_DN4546_c0_g1~~TRINITY_DN4546_c0_g1_i2.p1  ORF type:complete len:302 (-),score=81.99 TRINITY_DN4546_c0_g1_i2:509-1285(-)